MQTCFLLWLALINCHWDPRSLWCASDLQALSQLFFGGAAAVLVHTYVRISSQFFSIYLQVLLNMAVRKSEGFSVEQIERLYSVLSQCIFAHRRDYDKTRLLEVTNSCLCHLGPAASQASNAGQLTRLCDRVNPKRNQCNGYITNIWLFCWRTLTATLALN